MENALPLTSTVSGRVSIRIFGLSTLGSTAFGSIRRILVDDVLGIRHGVIRLCLGKVDEALVDFMGNIDVLRSAASQFFVCSIAEKRVKQVFKHRAVVLNEHIIGNVLLHGLFLVVQGHVSIVIPLGICHIGKIKFQLNVVVFPNSQILAHRLILSFELFFVNDSQTVGFCRLMLDAATASFFPIFTKISRMAQRHIFKRLGKKAEWNLHHAALLHCLVAVPFICEQSVHNVKAFGLEGSNGAVTGFDDFFFSFARHRLGQHCFHHVPAPPMQTFLILS
nr:MAG TPA: hypothetical protein [Caudoviricetes sp.]